MAGIVDAASKLPAPPAASDPYIDYANAATEAGAAKVLSRAEWLAAGKPSK